MDEMWNLWHGCHKKSEGCQHCYVFRRDAEFEKDSNVMTKTSSFNLPIRRDRSGNWKVPSGTLMWTCFTSDFFIEEADQWREDAWLMIHRRSDLHFFMITKRPERILQCLPEDWGDGYENVTYTIGESSEATDWYYAQTQKGGTWTIKFNLDERPTGRIYLTASIAGCSGSGSTITVKVNGTQRATWKPGFNDACIYRSAINSGRHYVYTTDFLNTGLKVGENTVSFTYSGGGSKDGIMYDCIKMEAGEPVTTGIATLTSNNTDTVKSTKYLHQGRLVIERDGQLYTVDGKRLR